MWIRRVLLPLLLIGTGTAFGIWGVPRLVPQGPVPTGTPTAPPVGDGWIDLLDAEHAAQWENITDDLDIFEITAERELHIFGKTWFPLRYAAFTGRRFADFDLHLEFRLAAGANSGVFFRTQRDNPTYRGWEIQVLEDHGHPPTKNSCGAMYDIATPMFNLSRPAGEWNSYDIRVRGGEVEVIMNGWRVLQVDLDQLTMPVGKFSVPFAELPREGLIALQDHGGEAWYRNIRIRPHAVAEGAAAG
jgi:hypothetical protein